ncbi:conserved hypothetical protein [Burkholderia ambifaria IOP40-10]|uniref:Uncharacterized protein n=1 Tax=Burkholderia ambifaria IOP40-10 TaxID=396596 RepID=B1FRS1_9BURK|nr:conserved hypothetical protein [Burkholderia ambifaria IOP40-10]
MPSYVPLPEPPSVSALPPRFTVEPDTPDNVPVDCGVVAALRSSVAPAPARSTALPDDRLPPAPTASVLPLPIVVPPVYEFVPVSVVVDGPFTARLPLPEIAPPRPRSFAPPTVSVDPAPRFTALVNVVPATLVPSVPPAPLVFSAPVPSAEPLPAISVPPPVRLVPPE